MVKEIHGRRKAVRCAVLAAAVVTALLTPLRVHAAQAVAVELPAGRCVREGEYFPLLLTLEEQGSTTSAHIRVTLGSMTFLKQTSVSPGSTRKVILWVVAPHENPEITIETRSEDRRWFYPQLARTLMDRLIVLPRREHIVGIISDSPNRELRWLFQRHGVSTVQVNPRLDFPEEVLAVYDLVAFEGSLWNTMSREMRRAIEDYVKSGGTAYISGDRMVPFDRTSWGLGGILLLDSEQRHMLQRPAQRNAVKERVLSLLGLDKPKEVKRVSTSEVGMMFEPLPRYLDWRPAWAVYLVVCSLALCAAGLCGFLRLWPRKYEVALMPALAAGLCAGFALVTPAGDLAYEQVSLVLAATDSDTVRQRSYVMLYGFGDSTEHPYELGADGLIMPAKSGWTGRRGTARQYPGTAGSPLLISNGEGAAVSALRIQEGETALFEVSRTLRLDGGFYVSVKGGKVRITNNSGFDLPDSVLVRSGTVTELGTLRFGQTAQLDTDGGDFIQEYLRRRFDCSTRRGRILAAFTERCWKKHMKPGNMYLVGWVGGAAPSGYAQADMLGTMWIVSVKKGG